jgi:hypothetical protein
MTVKDIEQAITKLPPAQVVELSSWFQEFESQLWDQKIEKDAKAGRFDSLIDQAKSEYAAGRCKPL